MQLCVDNAGDYFEHLMKSTLVEFLSVFFILHHYHILHTEISAPLITWQDEERTKKKHARMMI
jgi:hypothetical protein